MVGRVEELALLERLAGEAAAGNGSVVVVSGEAGVGKSRLLAEMVARAARAGLTTTAGRAVEGGGAYRPLADALLALQRTGRLPPPASVGAFAGAVATLVPGWASAPADKAAVDESLLVSEGLLRLLRVLGQERGALLALDDLHWADPDTVAVLDRLTDAVEQSPVLLLLATRHESPAPLERLAARADEYLALSRMSTGEAAELLDACAGGVPLPARLRQHVLARAEGLPFLVEELLAGLLDSGAVMRTADAWTVRRDLTASVPASFAAVVQQRLTSLDADARAVVQAAAVLGDHADWRILRAVTGQTEPVVLDALRVAVDRALLTHDHALPDQVRFVHALTRDVVLERLLPPERRELARRAAPLVEDGGDLVLAATLHEQAGERAHAARLLLTAGKRAGGAVGTREELLRWAAALAPDDDEVALALVEVLALAGRAADARQAGDPLLARLPGDDERRLTVALTLARASHIAGQNEDAVRYLAVAGEGPAVQALTAHVAFSRQRPAEAERLARSVIEVDDPTVRCEALEMVGRVARLHDRREEAEGAFSDALALARRHGLAVWEVRALHELGTLDVLGPARSDRLEAARELALRTGVLSTAALLDLQITAVHALRMEHTTTLEVARRGTELAESLRLPALAGAMLVFVATAQGHTGLVEQMHETLDEAENRLRGDLDKLAAARFARGTPAMAAHDLASWRVALDHGMRLFRTNPSSSPSPHRGLYALLETVLGDAHLEREELRRSGATVQACNRAALAYADAVAAARTGADPGPHLAEAERVIQPLVWRRHHLRLLVAPSAMRDGWGSPVEWLREGADYFAAANADGLARACRQQLRAAGVPVPRRGRGDSVVPVHLSRLGITSREMDVLALVVQGLPNAAIAERLVLSPRTVETHVASVLRKTGATDRSHLRRRLGSSGVDLRAGGGLTP